MFKIDSKTLGKTNLQRLLKSGKLQLSTAKPQLSPFTSSSFRFNNLQKNLNNRFIKIASAEKTVYTSIQESQISNLNFKRSFGSLSNSCSRSLKISNTPSSYCLNSRLYNTGKKVEDDLENKTEPPKLNLNSLNLDIGSSSGLAGKILSESTGIPSNEEQTSSKKTISETPEIKSDSTQTEADIKEATKNMTPAEKRRARRMRANLNRTEVKKSSSAKFASYGIMVGLIIGAIGYFGQPYSEEEAEEGLKDNDGDSGALQMFKRIFTRTKESYKFFVNPTSKKLLPDPSEDQMPYTLVVSLDDLLIHTSWDKEHGWRIAKRPFFDQFLSYMSSMYEIVIFSDQPSYSAEEALVKLDPYGYAPLRLYREQTRYDKGVHYKDLSYLNRDLSKVILLDIIPKEDSLQPENSVKVPQFKGEPGDDWLRRVIPFFEYVFMMETKDVREVLSKFGNGDLADEYQKWEKDLIEKLNNDWENKKAKKEQYSNTFMGSVGALVFGSATNSTTNSKPPVPQFIQMRNNMRSNFQVQHRKMLEIASEEMRKFEEEALKAKNENTIWTVAQSMAK
ncbi:Mitochondrial import inner membrane translocase subunit tim50 [Smittium culicis]|uniref:Mitochondrial import inner membrane translocase subunit TIM50 n=1 Tax=Smittium culicis TaxID=133412 RepID=A0A1R1WZA6_9FUNG|nr:Mitochondrial import inner membrane translocase subunit tim50 [Smittium culicis]